MREITTVIFDIGGVVVNGTMKQVYRALAEKLGVHYEAFEAAKKPDFDDAIIGNVSAEELVRNIAGRLGVDPAMLRSLWEQTYLELMTVNDDVIAILKQLRNQGITAALITNTIPIHSEINRKRKLYDLFDPALISNECGMRKPETGIYHELLRKLHQDAGSCVLIDDKEENLVPAAAIGMRTIRYRDPAQLRTDLRALGVL